MAPGTVKRFLECCACQIFNNDISFTSTSTSTFITLVKSVQKSHNQLVRKVRRLYEGMKLYYDRFSSRNGPGIFQSSANNREN